MIKSFFVWLLKFITVLAVLVIFGILAERMVKQREEERLAKYGRVGVVRVSGVILDSLDYIRRIRELLRDDKIDAILLRIDSPGGAVGPSQELFNFIRSIEKKPVVASLGTVAASGGLYVAIGAKKIYAQPGTITGSIGVIMQIPDISQLAEKVGVHMNVVKSGDLKDVGNIFRPMTEEERQFLDDSIRKVHSQFVRDIAVSRGLPEWKVREFADGRFLTGEEAFQLGIIDGFGDILQAASHALELAGITDKEAVLILPRDYSEILKELLKSTLGSIFESLLNRAMVMYPS